jgi:lipopolysaccharide cholinephosphotransferase
VSEKKQLVYFGAAGAGLAYCEHTQSSPDLFVDNDEEKWGTFIAGVEINSPTVLSVVPVDKVIITSGYVTDIYAQILTLGVSDDLIVIPPKSLLGMHPFTAKENRIQAASKLHEIMSAVSDTWNVVSVGGTALGLCRSNDFIHWDFDIDLFAPIQSKLVLTDLLKSFGYNPKDEGGSIKGTMVLDNGVSIPFGIDFFDAGSVTFIDRYEDYTWEWNTVMFTHCDKIEVHGVLLNVPNSFDEYLSKVYGVTWSVPNKDFSYSDYAGNLT